MECITISSDDEDVQILAVKLSQTPVKSEQSNGSNISIIGYKEVKKEKSVEPTTSERARLNGVSPEKKSFFFRNALVPVVSLIDDGDEDDFEDKFLKQIRSKIDVQLRNTEGSQTANNSISLKNGCAGNISSDESLQRNNEVRQSKKSKTSSKGSEVKGGICSESESDKVNEEEEDENKSNETLVKQLIEICRRLDYGAGMNVVERKIWNYFNAASPTKTQSHEFKTFLESCISRIESILSGTKDKFLISRIIKECINEMKNDPNVVDEKLRKLYIFYNKLVRRITKLEEAEVESDEDGGNPYIYLDRYRKKAVEVYNKICELEGRSSDADRPTLQRFFFTGSSAPIPIQRALERYYNKTHIFPDFYDVKKLTKKINKEDNLTLSESEIQKTAQNVFMEFGERLVKRRKYDDYNILVDYLKEDQCEDPADFDMELQMKLDQNKRTRKTEQEILDGYALLGVSNGKKEDDKSEKKTEGKEENNKQKLKPEEISVISLSSSSSSTSSLPTSPVSQNAEESEEDSDVKDSLKEENPENIIFSDSDLEFSILEEEDKKRKLELRKPSPKRLRTSEGISSENEPSSVDENNLIELDETQ